MSKKFRLPRKIKKKLKGRLFLYPKDEKTGGRLMAHPCDIQEDYDAVKKGIATDIIERKNSKLKIKEYRETMYKPIEMSDEELKKAVDNVFDKEYRKSSYDVLIKAKNSLNSIKNYYCFINSYKLKKYNICCMSVDSAKIDLKK